MIKKLFGLTYCQSQVYWWRCVQCGRFSCAGAVEEGPKGMYLGYGGTYAGQPSHDGNPFIRNGISMEEEHNVLRMKPREIHSPSSVSYPLQQ